MNTNRMWTVVLGAAVGAGAMYLLDPGQGRRRRAIVRDKTIRTARTASAAVDRSSRDLAHRTRGAAADLKGRWRQDQPTDEVVVSRVRSAVGRVVSHPHALEVTARSGRVRLAGPILANEVDAILSKVRSVRGVADVENALEVHDSPENTPALQGGLVAGDSDRWRSIAKLIVGVGSAVALGAGLAKTSTASTAAERS